MTSTSTNFDPAMPTLEEINQMVDFVNKDGKWVISTVKGDVFGSVWGFVKSNVGGSVGGYVGGTIRGRR